jgi:hypothetical protein
VDRVRQAPLMTFDQWIIEVVSSTQVQQLLVVEWMDFGNGRLAELIGAGHEYLAKVRAQQSAAKV